MTKKLVVNDGQSERELLLVGNIVVGRDPICEISGDNTLLSRRHAEFVVGADTVLVRDLGSRNGVFVNGAKVAEERLGRGDVVRIGHLVLHYVEDSAPLAVAIELASREMTSVVRSHTIPQPAGPRIATTAVAPGVDDDDYTRIVPSPASAPSLAASVDEEYTRLVPAPAAGQVSRGTLVMPADTSEDAEFTRLVSAPAPVPRAVDRTPPVAIRSADESGARVAEARPDATIPRRSGTAVRRLSTFVFAQVAILTALVYAAAAVPLVVRQATPLDLTGVIWLAGSALVGVVATYVIGTRIVQRSAAAFAALEGEVDAAAAARRGGR